MKEFPDLGQIRYDLGAYVAYASHPYTDGFTGFACKKNLIMLNYYIESLVNSMPKYEGEEEFIKEFEQTRLIDILKKEANQ